MQGSPGLSGSSNMREGGKKHGATGLEANEATLIEVKTRRLDETAANKSAPRIRQLPAKPTGADEWKERGNALFKKGNWAAAQEAYTK